MGVRNHGVSRRLSFYEHLVLLVISQLVAANQKAFSGMLSHVLPRVNTAVGIHI